MHKYKPTFRGNRSGYVEKEAGTWNRKRIEAQKRDFLKNSEAEYFRSVLEARFHKLPQGSDSDSSSEARSGHPMKLPCNVGRNCLQVQKDFTV
ncbi:hypothetical protein IGI04_036889 [Brassica rapa subsp. trilocularis]|uniref:TPX2 C-terminal domain-containing protein n=1 Tax=Brassica rapa subsp. trilocularis TaxID=1813537 RepID=A0ABQ7LFT0_BRACM|nr:hypothetical protein IGI04_036889 [Brassica rapa subsp. trilocularis]